MLGRSLELPPESFLALGDELFGPETVGAPPMLDDDGLANSDE
jgi:hypothetical protein